MSANQAGEAAGRVKEAAASVTGQQIVQNDSQPDQTRTRVVKDKGNSLVDTLPGRGTE